MENLKFILILLVVIIGIIVIGLFAINKADGHKDEEVEDYEIYPGLVEEKIENKENIILLDVRTPEEYEEVHLENALLLPVQVLSASTLEEIGLGEDMKDKEIIIYCRSGARSSTAYNIMKSLGYTNIKSVAGGMIHWEEDQYGFTESGKYEGVTHEVKSETVTDGAKINFNRTEHDFGVIPQSGGVVETTFDVENNGSETLEIGDITTSCSCTTASISSNKIEPGEKATLTVYFDPDFHEEPVDVFKRTVFIPTNDSSTPEGEVSIIVDIEEGV